MERKSFPKIPSYGKFIFGVSRWKGCVSERLYLELIIKEPVISPRVKTESPEIEDIVSLFPGLEFVPNLSLYKLISAPVSIKKVEYLLLDGSNWIRITGSWNSGQKETVKKLDFIVAGRYSDLVGTDDPSLPPERSRFPNFEDKTPHQDSSSYTLV